MRQQIEFHNNLIEAFLIYWRSHFNRAEWRFNLGYGLKVEIQQQTKRFPAMEKPNFYPHPLSSIEQLKTFPISHDTRPSAVKPERWVLDGYFKRLDMIINVVIEPSLNVNAFIHSINKKLDKQIETCDRLQTTDK